MMCRSWIEVGAKLAKSHVPLAGCEAVMRLILEAGDRAERIACLLSDVVLAQALNWATVLPVIAQRLTEAVLRYILRKGRGVIWKYSNAS